MAPAFESASPPSSSSSHTAYIEDVEEPELPVPPTRPSNPAPPALETAPVAVPTPVASSAQVLTVGLNSYRYRKSTAQVQGQARRLFDLLHLTHDRCPFCWAHDGSLEPHTWAHCHLEDDAGVLLAESTLRDLRMHYPPGQHVCFFCHTPPVLEDDCHTTGQKKPDSCIFRWFLKEAFWAMQQWAHVRVPLRMAFPELDKPDWDQIGRAAGVVQANMHVLAKAVLWREAELRRGAA